MEIKTGIIPEKAQAEIRNLEEELKKNLTRRN